MRPFLAGAAPLLLAHAVLLCSVVALVLTAGLALPWRMAWLVAAAGPLLAAVPGLLAQRRYTLQWLAILLVVYVGAALMEVIAAATRLHFATLVLLAALLELAFVLQRVRRH